MNRVTVTNRNKNGIYIGRGSPYGNPFAMSSTRTRDQVCDDYETYFKDQVQNNRSFKQALDSLVNKAQTSNIELSCFCAPLRCHGDTIKRYIDKQLTNED